MGEGSGKERKLEVRLWSWDAGGIKFRYQICGDENAVYYGDPGDGCGEDDENDENDDDWDDGEDEDDDNVFLLSKQC